MFVFGGLRETSCPLPMKAILIGHGEEAARFAQVQCHIPIP